MNYDTMEAGREMDALVAKLMGWMYFHKIHYCEDSWYEWCEYCHAGNENSGKPLNRSGDDEKIAGECDTPPPYSTSISAAWEVVEKTWELGFYGEIGQQDIKGTWQTIFISKEDRGMYHGALAPTAPLAICRAALKSVGEKG
jgi:hypothetical protein